MTVFDQAEQKLTELEGRIAALEAGTPPPPDPEPDPEPEPTPDDLVIPPTLPYPNGVKKDDESFEIMLQCTDEVDRSGNVISACEQTAAGNNHHASLEYIGHSMPYLYPEAVPGNHDHGWWVAGDREGYKGAYCFLYDKHPNPFGHDVIRKPGEGVFIARATVVRPLEAGYGKVNDKYMDEGVRFYDGTLTGQTGGEISAENLQEVALDDFDYDAYVPVGPQDIRIGLFRGDGAISDIRDFTKVSVASMPNGSPAGHFEFIGVKDAPEFGGRRVTVVFITHKGQVSHVIYYDTLNSGLISAEVDGETIGE